MRKGIKIFAFAAIIILLFSLTPARASDDGHCVVGATAGSTTWYFAEGCTRPGFNTFLCLGNSNPEAVNAHVAYFLGDGSVLEKDYPLAPLSRFTVPLQGEGELGYADGARGDVSIEVTAAREIVAERPMYFNYAGNLISGGHDVVGATSLSKVFYFAEGYTGPGFDEWICVLNPQGAAARLTFRFQTQEAGEVVVPGLSVLAHSRGTFKVNDLLGPDYQASLKLESDQPVVAERPMYFAYTSGGGSVWKGGHCVVGATSAANSCYFAEGTTRSGFEEWITLQNAGASPITVTAEYQLGPDQGTVPPRDYVVEAGRRATLRVPEEVGPDKDVSVKLTCPSPFLAERPIYFDYQGWGADYTGGHCVIGAVQPGPRWLFAEGYTGPGFQT